MLSGKTAVVTGGAKKLGKAIAIALAKQGANVVVHYLSSEAEAEKTVNEVKKLGVKSIAVKADLTKPREAERLFEKIFREFGSVDILVNNVGNFVFKPIEKVSVKEWNYVVEGCLNCTFYCCTQALGFMRRKKFGRIINIGQAGVEELKARPNTTAYFAAKTGVLILTKSLAVAEAKNNVSVNMVSPGVMETSVVKPEGKTLPRGYTKFEDVVNAVLFLLKPESRLITGANIDVSGGYWP